MSDTTPRDKPVSLSPLTPEAALRALFAVKPQDDPSDDAPKAQKDPAHEGPGE